MRHPPSPARLMRLAGLLTSAGLGLLAWLNLLTGRPSLQGLAPGPRLVWLALFLAFGGLLWLVGTGGDSAPARRRRLALNVVFSQDGDFGALLIIVAGVVAGHGLAGVRERLEGVGGWLEVATRTGDGFRVQARVPAGAGP